MNLTILLSTMGKYLGRMGSLTLVWQLIYEKEYSEFKPVKLHLKLTLCNTLLMQRGWCIYIYIYIYVYVYIYIYINAARLLSSHPQCCLRNRQRLVQFGTTGITWMSLKITLKFFEDSVSWFWIQSCLSPRLFIHQGYRAHSPLLPYSLVKKINGFMIISWYEMSSYCFFCTSNNYITTLLVSVIQFLTHYCLCYWSILIKIEGKIH